MDQRPKVLIVEDEPFNIEFLAQVLEDLDCRTSCAANGKDALNRIAAELPDLILLDIMMPEMDGFQVLKRLKDHQDWRDIPVVIISALDDLEFIARGVRMGADDYLPKPFDPILLKARIEACLDRKRWHDQEQAYLAIIQAEREKSEQLLVNMLPEPVAERLKGGEKIIADSFREVTILFADLVNFTPLTTQMSASELVILLNDLFSIFDQLVHEHGLEKIRAIGDEFVVAGGLPLPDPDHAEKVADLALAMRNKLIEFNQSHQSSLSMRMGMDTGPVIAGVIGTTRYSYDLWGDAMNTASRMQSHGFPNRIQVTSATYERLKGKFQFEERGLIEIKGKGEMLTYFLISKNTGAAE